MRKVTLLFSAFLIIIISGLLLFFFLDQGKKISMTYLIQSEQNRPVVDDFSYIYREIFENSELTGSYVDFGIAFFKNLSEFEKQLQNTVKSNAQNVIFCDFTDDESFDLFLQLKGYLSPFYISLYDGDFEQSDQKKEILNLFPSPNRLADALNQLFHLSDSQSILVVKNKNCSDNSNAFITDLNGKITTISLGNDDNLKNIISSVGETLSETNPDYLLLDLNEKDTIILLEKIVGYPRDKIILITQNTSEQVGYYTGSNSYGVNGITFSNPSEIKGYNNRDSILRMITKVLLECFIQYKQLGLTQLEQYLLEHPETPFGLEGNHLVTPIYRISFSEKGLRVISRWTAEQ